MNEYMKTHKWNNSQRSSRKEQATVMAHMAILHDNLQSQLAGQIAEQMEQLTKKFSEIAAETIKTTITESGSLFRRDERTPKGTPASGAGSGGGLGGGPGGGPGDGAGNAGGGTNWRYRKLDMPLFDGSHPDGWILRAERYFSFYKLSEADKVEAAVVALEGDALLWFQWEYLRTETIEMFYN
ncbi:hypothetical protein LXL04_018332 [Taraxacum kok-saghyz]